MLVSVDGNVRLTVCTPLLAGEIAGPERQDLFAELIAEAERIAREAGCRYLEATVSDGKPAHAEWGRALSAQGFTLSSEKTALQRAAEPLSADAALACAFEPAEAYARAELERLYAACLLGTLDRSDAGGIIEAPLSFAALLPEGNMSASHAAWVARARQSAAGMLILQLTDAAAWIAFVGVAEPFRRQGIGSGLVRFGIAQAGASGRNTVRALIDVGNEPSLDLHRKAGFEMSIGTFHIYQRRLGA